MEELVAIVENRWNMLHTILHAVGYLLDPQHHGEGQEKNEEVMAGFHKFLEKQLPNVEDQVEALVEYEKYRNRMGLFSSAAAWAAARLMPAHAWWLQFGGGVPRLQDIAVKALSQVNC